jgi:hypothetical protein
MTLNQEGHSVAILKLQIQAKLAEKKLQRDQLRLSKPPRYDKVFFEGVKWLDSLTAKSV